MFLLAVSSLSRGGIKNLVLLPQIPSHVLSEPCSELSQETSEDAFLVFFHAPCTQFCVEKLWSPTLGPSCAVPWQTVAVTFTPSSVRFNLLQKCVTSQWEVTGTVVYVPRLKCQMHTLRTQATMKQKGSREGNTCGVGWDREWNHDKKKKKLLYCPVLMVH